MNGEFPAAYKPVPSGKQSLLTMPWSSLELDSNHIVLQCNSQIGPMFVVVGEERHFENAFVEEPRPVALGTVWSIDHGDTVIEHPRAVFSPRV